MDSFERFIVIMLVIVLLVIKPLQYASSIQESINTAEAECLTREFIDNLCIRHELSVEEYEAFVKKLTKTGNVYQIELTLGQLVEEIETTAVVSHIHDTGKLQFLAAELPHSHSEDCYFGYRHICSAFGGSCYTWDPYYYQYPHTHNAGCPRVSHAGYGVYCVTSSYAWICGHGNGASDPGATTVTNSIETYYCNYCGAQTGVRTEYDCPICPSGGWSGSTGSCSNTTITCTTQYDYSGEYVKNCGKISGHYYDQEIDETDNPKCHLVVTHIQPAEYYQEVEQGEEINTSCWAWYLDGHTMMITAGSDYVRELGDASVTLSYHGLVYTAKTMGSINEIIQVNTIKYFICLDCDTKYKSDEDGEDPGCPVCQDNILELRVVTLKEEYTVGESLELNVIAVYKDREEIVTGWMSDYDAYQVGEQNFAVYYGEHTANATVWVVEPDQKAVCPDCGTEYDEAENPDCPVCTVIVEMRAFAEKTQVTIGEDPGIYIVFTYQNGNQELLNEGLEINGLNLYAVGEQEVQVSCEGYSDTLIIMVMDGEGLYVLCDNGHRYHLNEDGSDPGCPYCGVYQEEDAYQFLDITYHDVLLQELYENGTLVFDTDSYLSIKITAKPSIMKRTKDMILSLRQTQEEYLYQYGKEIR